MIIPLGAMLGTIALIDFLFSNKGLRDWFNEIHLKNYNMRN